MTREQDLKAIRDLIYSAETSIRSARKMIESLTENSQSHAFSLDEIDMEAGLKSYNQGDATIIEGVFTGESMLGPDGTSYPVPQNYASKSLLVQGSRLKATIENHGGVKYKIIEEIPYETLLGIVTQNGEKFEITTDKKTFRVLRAAITFHRCNIGDTVSIRIPRGKDATYAVIESVIPKI